MTPSNPPKGVKRSEVTRKVASQSGSQSISSSSRNKKASLSQRDNFEVILSDPDVDSDNDERSTTSGESLDDGSEGQSDDDFDVPRQTKRRKLNPKKSRSSEERRSKSRPVKSSRSNHLNPANALNENLPPINNIPDIFKDMTDRALAEGFEKVVRYLSNQKLKIATMCSALQKKGLNFGIDHVFSAEIVPFKQAYIERNFKPKTLFRDIHEVATQPLATTAYGAPAAVPVAFEIDILVAGFACVDFSRLNNHRKDLMDNGESADTHRSILHWADKKRPSIVILENLNSTPWTKIQSLWNSINYSTGIITADTKKYYLPHTRNRVYMIAINQVARDSQYGLLQDAANSAVKDWIELMLKFKRPASSSVEEFLLDETDSRLIRAMKQIQTHLERSRDVSRSAWAKCELRHLNYREEEKLGSERPLTKWSENGHFNMVDFGKPIWLKPQVDRVKDVIDMNGLRGAKRGYDISYKTRFLDLSQNIDRNIDKGHSGFTGCMTPQGIPYSTTRGGPIVGLEALALQGLPIDRLSLTNETQRELQDLAGNAMTSTVVGAAIISALLVGFKAIPQRTTESTTFGETKKTYGHGTDDQVSMDDSNLDLRAVNFGPSDDSLCTKILLSLARQSTRLCSCDDQLQNSKMSIRKCELCSHTACRKCAGNPEHQYLESDVIEARNRKQPLLFVEGIKKALPMRLSLEKFSFKNSIQAYKNRINDWEQLDQVLGIAIDEDFCFHSLKRSRTWTVHYDALNYHLELRFEDNGAMWLLFAKPDATSPVNSKTREILNRPIARMINEGPTFLDGTWHICVPTETSHYITVTGAGKLVPSWKAALGLEEFLDEKIWSDLVIETNPEMKKACNGIEIGGIYKFRPLCGTASGTLFVKDGIDRIYFFLDAARIGEHNKDRFVFSMSHHRLEHGETRDIIASVRKLKSAVEADPLWRPSHTPIVQMVECLSFGTWIESKALLVPATRQISIIKSLSNRFDIETALRHFHDDSINDCRRGLTTVLSCKIPLRKRNTREWSYGAGTNIDQVHAQETFAELAWLIERVRHVVGIRGDWKVLSEEQIQDRCQMCSPARPDILWRYRQKRNTMKMIPYEDPATAGTFERDFKSRPSSVVTNVKLDQDTNGVITIALNPLTLAHRAVAKLLCLNASDKVDISWRLVVDTKSETHIFAPLELQNNENDQESDHVFPGFKMVETQKIHYTLRQVQRKSLSWMITQEKSPKPFFEQEVEEACVDNLGWRVEAIAKREVSIRGGLLADEVGFGKTITTLALIDSQKEPAYMDSLVERPGYISIKATLVIVPVSLVEQWKDEAKKFLGVNCTVMVVADMTHLNSKSIKEFRDADIIVTTDSLLTRSTFLKRISLLAALPEPPTSLQDRSFSAWTTVAGDRLRLHVEKLKNCGFPIRYDEDLRDTLVRARQDQDLNQQIPSKRLKGKAYAVSRAAADKKRLLDGQSKSAERTATTETPCDFEEDFSVPENAFNCFGFAKAMSLNDLKGVPFNVFYFSRVVMDEYPYVSLQNTAGILAIKASCRWILSGTPALGDFGDVKVIAKLLGINLGVDDDTQGIIGKLHVKSMEQNRTAVERFEALHERHSPAWHSNRHQYAQHFLQVFARQNTHDYDLVDLTTTYKAVRLPPLERLVYLELQMQLKAQEMLLQPIRRTKIAGDRAQRLSQLLSTSRSAEEALLRRCAYYIIDANQYGAGSSKELVAVRAKERIAATHMLQQLLLPHRRAISEQGTVVLDEWRNLVDKNCYGDKGAAAEVSNIIGNLQNLSLNGTNDAPIDGSEAKKIKEQVSQICKELASRFKDSRWTYNVRALQNWQSSSNFTPITANCSHSVKDPSEAYILGSCGHVVCMLCAKSSDEQKKCSVSECGIPAMHYQFVCATELGCEEEGDRLTRKYHGKKIQDIVALVRATRNRKNCQNEKFIIFVQFNDVMDMVAKGFEAAGIDCSNIRDNKSTNMKQLEDFKNDTVGKKVVLILKSDSSSAAGHNITNANHIIFVSPQHAERPEYIAAYTQMIGRARRFGQTKTVHAYHFLALKTIDIEVIEDHNPGDKLIFPGGAHEIESCRTDLVLEAGVKRAEKLEAKDGQNWRSEGNLGLIV